MRKLRGGIQKMEFFHHFCFRPKLCAKLVLAVEKDHYWFLTNVFFSSKILMALETPRPLMAKVMKISIFVGFLLYSGRQRKKYHSPDRLGHTDSQEPDTGSLCIWILMGTRHLGPGIIIWLMTIHHYWQSLLNLASFRLHLLWRSSFLFGNQQCTSYSNNSIFIAAQRHKGTLFLVVAIRIVTSIITIKVNLEFNLSRRVAVTSLRNALTIFALFSSPAPIFWFDYYEGSMIMMMMMMCMIIW